MMKKNNIVNSLVFLMIIIFLFSYFKPNLIFSDTTLSGGDTGSHNYLAKFMVENLFNNFRLTGWSDAWYGGFPIFRFYFPFLYLLNALFSLIINFNTSFKIITVLGTFLLPFSAYYAFKLMKFDFPVPIVAALFTIPFLFLENNSMYGGNIPSTLAGEFTYSFALALSLLFIGYFYRGITTYKGFILSVVVLSVIALSHVIPVFVLTFSCLLFLSFFNKREIKFGILVFIFAFFIIAFWTIPFLFYSDLTTSMRFIPDRNLKLLIPENILFLMPLAILGGIYAIKKHDKRILFFFSFLFVSLLSFLFMPKGHIWNVRFLPFYYLGIGMIAAYSFGILYEHLRFRFKQIAVIFLTILVLLLVNYNVSFIDSWIKWNYSGFENKDKWETFNEMNLFLNNLDEGKVFYEYTGKHNEQFGTPRSFELIPYFTNKATMEGLLIESGINSPYHFILQSETTFTPTCPISGLRCNNFDLKKAYKHLEMFNIKYFVASTDDVKDSIRNDTNFKLLKSIDFIDVFELKRKSSYVDFLRYEPVIMDKRNFRQKSLEWFKSNYTDVEIVYNDKGILNFKRISKINEIGFEAIDYNGCYVDENYKSDKIVINTDCIGKPLLVKVSYFPEWKAVNGRLYPASPAFMMLIPEKEDVLVYHGSTFIDNLGMILTFITVLILVFYRKKILT